MTGILWIDDDTDDPFGRFFTQACSDEGVAITAVHVGSREIALDAVASAAKDDFSLVVVDWQLGLDDLTGIGLSQRLAQSWGGPVMFLTRFPKHDSLGPFLDPRQKYRELVKPDLEPAQMRSWFTETFLPVYRELLAAEHIARPPYAQADLDAARAYFGINLDSLRQMPLDEQLALKTNATSAISNEVAEVFVKTSARWIVVAGWPLAIVRVEARMDAEGRLMEPPSREALREDAREWSSPTALIYRSARVNIISSAGRHEPEVDVDDQPSPSLCMPRERSEATAASSDWFPTVRIEARTQVYDFHFDTGSELSFLAYSTLRSDNVAPVLEDSDDWGVMSLQVGLASEVQVLVAAWRSKMRFSSVSGQVGHSVRMYLVRSFDDTGLSLECRPTACPLAPVNREAHDGRCRYRRGLVGRDLLLQTEWPVVIDPVHRSVFS